MKDITRFELITKDGREVIAYANMRFDLQDDGKTLKVFVDTPLTAEQRSAFNGWISKALYVKGEQ